MSFLAELLINGALLGLMYSMAALGIALIYKSSSVANFAQGSMIMTAGYLIWVFTDLGIPIYLAIALAIVAMFAFGFVAERLMLRRMVGQPIIMIVMVTLGLDIFLRGLVPGLAGANPKYFSVGVSIAPLNIHGLFINRAYIVGAIVALVMIGLSLLFFRTRLGTKLRAVSDDHVSSWSVGISVEHAVALSWGLAGVSAVGAAAIWGSSQGVTWTLSSLLLPAFAVVVLGGMDSIYGTLVGGLILGMLSSVVSGYVDPLVNGSTSTAVTAIVILLTIVVRPYGIFGREDIERI